MEGVYAIIENQLKFYRVLKIKCYRNRRVLFTEDESGPFLTSPVGAPRGPRTAQAMSLSNPYGRPVADRLKNLQFLSQLLLLANPRLKKIECYC